MHGEFPCKFFHTNVECYQNEKCQYSHAPLTEETRAMLRNCLNSSTLPDDPLPFRPAVSSAASRGQETRQVTSSIDEFQTSSGEWTGSSPREENEERNYEGLCF